MLKPELTCPCGSTLKPAGADRALCLGCRSLLKWDGVRWLVTSSLTVPHVATSTMKKPSGAVCRREGLLTDQLTRSI